MDTIIYILGRALCNAYLKADRNEFVKLIENNHSDFYAFRPLIDDLDELNEQIEGVEIMLVLTGAEIKKFEEVTGYILYFGNDNN
jgi:hypothetical protein